MAEHKKKHHGFKHTHMEHHDDGSMTVHHQHENPEHDVKHAVADLDGAHDSMESHLGTPNPGEVEANAGMPAPAAAGPAPAGVPMPGAGA